MFHDLFGSSGLLGILCLKRILIPVSVVMFNRKDGLTYRCLYIFGVRLAYWTTK